MSPRARTTGVFLVDHPIERAEGRFSVLWYFAFIAAGNELVSKVGSRSGSASSPSRKSISVIRPSGAGLILVPRLGIVIKLSISASFAVGFGAGFSLIGVGSGLAFFA